MSRDKDEESYGAFPYITTGEMAKWDILLRAHLSMRKNADRALFEAKPKPDQEAIGASLAEDGKETEATKVLHAAFKTRMKKWRIRDTTAKAALVKACGRDPSAFVIIKKFPAASARKLYVLLHGKFNQRDMTNVIQAKLSAFNSLTISKDETVSTFIDSIVNAQTDLYDLGQDYINDDIHCLSRLKEGIRHDDRYATLSLTMSAALDLSWDRAVQMARALDATGEALKTSSKPDTVRKLEQSVRFLKKQLGKSKKPICNLCGKL